MLNLQGGPTHIETFDPKMSAPNEYRAMFGETKTSLPGVTGSHFPMSASWHTRWPWCAAALRQRQPCQRRARGARQSARHAWVNLRARGGLNNGETGLPNNTLVVPAAMGERFADRAPYRPHYRHSDLPQAYAAFDPSKGGDILNDMKLNLPSGRFEIGADCSISLMS